MPKLATVTCAAVAPGWGDGSLRDGAPMTPTVYVMLAPLPDEDDPRRHCPRALVVVRRDEKWEVHTVYPPDRRALGSRAAANAVMLPAAQKWLRQRGWRTYDVFAPHGAAAAGGNGSHSDEATTQGLPQPLTLPMWR